MHTVITIIWLLSGLTSLIGMYISAGMVNLYQPHTSSYRWHIRDLFIAAFVLVFPPAGVVWIISMFNSVVREAMKAQK